MLEGVTHAGHLGVWGYRDWIFSKQTSITCCQSANARKCVNCSIGTPTIEWPCFNFVHEMKKLHKNCSIRRGTTLPELFSILTKSNGPQATQGKVNFILEMFSAIWTLPQSWKRFFQCRHWNDHSDQEMAQVFIFQTFRKLASTCRIVLLAIAAFIRTGLWPLRNQQPKQEKERKPLTSCLRRTVDFPSRMSCRRTCERKVGREPRISWATENGFAMK